MIPSFPHRYCSGDVTSGQIRLHVTQYALFVWSTTHVELPGHKTSRHVSESVKTARCCEKGIKIWPTQGNVPRSAWGIYLTFALSLVLYIQVRVSFALRLQQRALVLVGLPVGAADGSLPGDVGAVWCANAARLTPPVHLAPLSGAAVNIVAGFYNSEDCVMSCEGAFSSPRVTILGRATALNFRLGSPPALTKRNNCAL